MKNILKNKLISISLFITLGFFALQIPLTQIYGTAGKFSLFDSFAPIAGAFLGSIPGIFAVLGMRIVDYAIHGTEIDKGMIIRLFPVVFGAIYFVNKKKFEKLNIIIPVISIIAFNLHPVGRSVWFFSLYWLIPIAMHFFKDKSLFARSLGATFAQHSVGGALWIWFLNMPAELWIALIPIVAIERFAIAVGMSGSFLAFNNIFGELSNYLKKKNINLNLQINKKYLFRK